MDTSTDFEGLEVEARHQAIGGSDGYTRLGTIAGRAFEIGRIFQAGVRWRF